VTPREKIGCDGRFDYYEQTYRCWKRSGHGSSDLHTAIRESCDCYFYEVARRTGIEAIAAMARKLGLGQVYDAGFAGLKRGVIPDPDWKRGRFGRGWLGGETILTGIGQGYTLTTPLQLAVMTARLASGRRVMPTFVKRAESLTPPPLDVRPEWVAAMRRGMVAVCNEGGGTGHNAQPENGDYVVAGKTGTSQVSRHSSESAQSELRWELRDHALFVSFAPADKPKYAMATVVEHGGGGGATAAPLARDIMDLVMARDPAGKTSISELGSDVKPAAKAKGG
jgi:penicillin-binding protein 2